MSEAQTTVACVGLRAKTGRAVGVVLAGPHASPQPITLMDLPWDRAVLAVRKAEHALEECQRSLSAIAAWLALHAVSHP